MKCLQCLEDALGDVFTEGIYEGFRRCGACGGYCHVEAAAPIRRLLTFEALRSANRARLSHFKNAKGLYAHSMPDGSDWKLSAWSNAVLGELGEAANMIKKIERGDFTIEEGQAELAKELADVATYLDILAFRAGIDLGLAVQEKFNEVSERVGSPVRL